MNCCSPPFVDQCQVLGSPYDFFFHLRASNSSINVDNIHHLWYFMIIYVVFKFQMFICSVYSLAGVKAAREVSVSEGNWRGYREAQRRGVVKERGVELLGYSLQLQKPGMCILHIMHINTSCLYHNNIYIGFEYHTCLILHMNTYSQRYTFHITYITNPSSRFHIVAKLLSPRYLIKNLSFRCSLDFW